MSDLCEEKWVKKNGWGPIDWWNKGFYAKRDRIDSSREFSPLKRSEDSWNRPTDLTIDEQIENNKNNKNNKEGTSKHVWK